MPILLAHHLRLAQRQLVYFPDVACQVGGGAAEVVAQGADERLLASVDGAVVAEGLLLVGFVLAVGAVELIHARMVILAVEHLVKPHKSVAALVAGEGILAGVHLSVVLERGFRFQDFSTFVTRKFLFHSLVNNPHMGFEYVFVFNHFPANFTSDAARFRLSSTMRLDHVTFKLFFGSAEFTTIVTCLGESRMIIQPVLLESVRQQKFLSAFLTVERFSVNLL